MEKYIYLIVGTIFGIAISLYVYGVKREYYAKRLKRDQENYSTKKLDDALEKAVHDMQLKMKLLNRKLTEEEKNNIIFGRIEEEKKQ